MKVKEVIRCLSELNPEEEIIAAWWEAKDFGFSPKSKPWLKTVSWGDSMDWSRINEQVQDQLDAAQMQMKEISCSFSGVKYNFQISV